MLSRSWVNIHRLYIAIMPRLFACCGQSRRMDMQPGAGKMQGREPEPMSAGAGADSPPWGAGPRGAGRGPVSCIPLPLHRPGVPEKRGPPRPPPYRPLSPAIPNHRQTILSQTGKGHRCRPGLNTWQPRYTRRRKHTTVFSRGADGGSCGGSAAEQGERNAQDH